VTCIVGIVHNGSVYMGGDASEVAEYNIRWIFLNRIQGETV